MLAYAFWHWKRPEVSQEVYEARQCAFQEALAADPPEGFFGASTVRLRGATWAAGGGGAYEDWYLIADMTALGSLNDAAVPVPAGHPIMSSQSSRPAELRGSTASGSEPRSRRLASRAGSRNRRE